MRLVCPGVRLDIFYSVMQLQRFVSVLFSTAVEVRRLAGVWLVSFGRSHGVALFGLVAVYADVWALPVIAIFLGLLLAVSRLSVYELVCGAPLSVVLFVISCENSKSVRFDGGRLPMSMYVSCRLRL